MGFDRPWWVQYLDFMGGVLRGDLGQSLHYRQDVAALIGERLPHTLQLTAVAVTLAVLVALPAGVVSAVRPNSLADAVSRVVALPVQLVCPTISVTGSPVKNIAPNDNSVTPTMTTMLWAMRRRM